MGAWVLLRSAAALLDGPTIDFGCGVGELLRELPPGSTGLEINQATVEHCRRHGLDVMHYDALSDGWSLSTLAGEGRRYRSMVISHVLEHLDQPLVAFNSLLKAARRLGVHRVLVIVPGKVGYASDPTHLTFVDAPMLESADAVASTGFGHAKTQYYPLNKRAIGDIFIYHELRVLYERRHGTPDE